MAVATIGDVFPAIGRFAAADLGLHGRDAEPSLDELPASVLSSEWLSGGRLMPPITSRLVPLILDDEPLRRQQYQDIFPDLGRSTRPLASTSGLGQTLAKRLSEIPGARWQSSGLSPAVVESEWGRSAALELTTAAIREAVAQGETLSSLPRQHPTGIRSAISAIADWAAGEMGLTHLGSALAAARDDAHVPPEVRQALAVVDATPLGDVTTGFGGPYDVSAALRQLLRFDARSGVVLEHRVYAGKTKETLDEIGQRLKVTRERVRQIEVHLRKQIAIRLESQEYDVVRRAAARLRDRVGDCRRIATLPDDAAWALDLEQAPSEERAFHSRFLMQLCGPWHEYEAWLLHDSCRALPSLSRKALDERAAEGPIPEAEALDVLGELGVPEEDRPEWLAVVCHCRVIDGQAIRWRGSLADKSAAVLAMRGEPLTSDELAAILGPDTNYRSMIGQVQGDDRFMRRALKLYGLRSWGGEEYTTIKEEIEQEIARQGGAASLEHLIETLCTQFGVSEASVRAYASAAPFVRTEEGTIAVGAGATTYERRLVEDCRGCFRTGTHWAWRVIVDREILRGSGRPLPAAVLQSIGMRPGDVRQMATPAGEIMLRYGRQPTVGSLRRAAMHVGCGDGDRLFVVLHSEDQLDFMAVHLQDIQSRTGVDRLAAEAGVTETDDSIAAVAHALGLPPDEYRSDAIKRRLRARREHDLLELAPDSGSTAADDDLLDELIGLGE